MTSRELAEWSRSEDAGESTETMPDQAGPPIGQHIIHILGKRRTDLNDEDVAIMQKVVNLVHNEPPVHHDLVRREFNAHRQDSTGPAVGTPPE